MQKVYLDSAATTQVREEVIAKMQDALANFYGNPSSTHSFGRSAKTMIEKTRKTIAKRLNASPSEIIFTSGGTEADNMILSGAVRDLGVEHIITSKIEHHAVLHTIDQLKETYKVEVSYVKLDEKGTPDITNLETLLKGSNSKTLVSLMHVNNEIGNMIDIDAFADVCKEHDALFHSDSVQSIGHWEWDVQKTKADFLTAAAHKFHGPKGIGFAYIRKNIPLKPLIYGGEQERGFRAGTEAFHNIVGLEEAFIQAYDHLEEERNYVSGLKNYFIEQLKTALPGVEFNGTSAFADKSTYTLVNVRLPFSAEKGALLLFQLDIKGIACSKGSACQSGSSAGSHVLNEILSEEDTQKPSVRFSFSKYNTKEELDYVVACLKEFAES
ncbi:cysteine desulfurase family protein [Galbibacter sp. EGI 63066]|uniref:cysteine desulfurase family protein n=1 Tax=Galbibacter sp. EGI 63066 TaxID=2993559 RepID=UPI0022497FB9|nr:cysteine desulfurase family protein [Galbibacter sp. EGI 63066]MCX2680289.1 cysteine desulfurase family protein [Galbibacter sp. EGI 63066]